MTKIYDFDDIPVRRGTSSVKHDMVKEVFGTDDLLPMWVADMDFRTPDFIVEAIRQRCNHEVLGYTFAPEGYICAVVNWLQKHYNIETGWKNMHFIPGIVQGIAFVLQCFTEPGDKVLVTTPVYPPFLNIPHRNRRIFVNSSLKIANGRFQIDFDDLEQKARDCKVMILANPHNPGGTVWTASELRQVAEICQRHHVLVIADEIHADLTLPGFQHTSFSTVSEEAWHNSITFIAPSKTFNMAGLASSVCYVPDPEVRKRFFGYLDANEFSLGALFAYIAAEAAFRYGDEWRLQLLDYLQGNIDFCETYLREHLPEVTMMRPEASFLLWLDFREMKIHGQSHACNGQPGWTQKELADFLIREAKVGLNNGIDYGPDGEGYMRMNIGTSRAQVKACLDRIVEAVRNA